MKVKFVGNPLDERDARAECQMFGLVFVHGQEVDVSDLPVDMQRRLAGNHHFEVTEWDSGRKPVRPRARKDKDVSNG